MLKAVKMASVRGIVCVVCVWGGMLGISLYSSVTKEAPRASHGQVWASICFGAARKNYMNH